MGNERKKILIITYYWPPAGGVAVQRWVKFAKYLKSLDWNPIIYAPLNPNYPMFDHSYDEDIKDIKVVKSRIWEPYNLAKVIFGRKKTNIAGKIDHGTKKNFFKKALFYIRGNFFIPDARKFWIKPSISFLKDYIQKEKISFVIATAPPLSSVIIATRLKKLLPIHVIVDFRDHWFFMDNVEDFQFSKRTLRLHEKLKKEVSANCDAIVAVSESFLQEYDCPPETITAVIPNGFDKPEFEYNPKDFSWPDKFVIGHYGTMGSDRNYKILWDVLEELCAENEEFKKDLEIILVGNVDQSILYDIGKTILKDNLTVNAFVPHHTILKRMRDSAVLFLPINKNHSSQGRIPAKLFDYMGVNRPILAIAQDKGDAEKIINECEVGQFILSDERETLKSYLLKIYTLFNSNEKWTSNEDINNYTRKELSHQLDKLLRKVSLKADN